MSTDGAVRTSAPPLALFAALIDDAAIFPPGNATMPAAVAGHLAARTAPYSWLVGRFVCTASRLDELAEAASAAGAPEPIAVSVIADAGVPSLRRALDSVAVDSLVKPAAVEIVLPRDGEDFAMSAACVVRDLPDVEAYIELQHGPGWLQALRVIADSPYAAKLRTGGMTHEAFPTEGGLAAFIVRCVRLGLRFKLTAGLHRAVRHRNPATGFEHHGFLNAVLATDAAARGAEEGDVERVLATRESSALVHLLGEMDADRCTATRSFFVSFGSCSIREPVDDLVALECLPEP